VCEDFDIALDDDFMEDDILEEDWEDDDDFMDLDDDIFLIFDVRVFEDFDVLKVLVVIFEESLSFDVFKRDLVRVPTV